jgi:hypothetical protein
MKDKPKQKNIKKAIKKEIEEVKEVEVMSS